MLVGTVATIYSRIDFSRVWNRKRRGTVVPSVRAFVDSVWAFVDSVWMVVKIGASCLIDVTFNVFIYFKICIYIHIHIYIYVYVYPLIIWVYSWVEGDSTLLIVLMRKKSRSYNCGKWEGEFKEYLRGIHIKGYRIWPIHRLILVRYNNFVDIPIYLGE